MMSSEGRIAVVLGRFEDLLERGLRGLVEDDASLELLADGVAPENLDPVLRACPADVALLDPGLLPAPAALRELALAHPVTQFVLLADEPSQIECAQLLAFGAAACLAKSSQERDVLNAIHLASRGLQLAPRGARSEAASGLLTPREADVLAYLQDRRSNAQIAAELHISVETVRTHARHIYRKLGVSSRRELAPLGRARAA